MKKLYGLFDCTAGELATTFFANNDEHAVHIMKQSIKKAPLEVVVKVVKFDVDLTNYEIVSTFEPLPVEEDK